MTACSLAHPVAASLLAGSSARWATRANTTCSTTSVSRRRHAAARRIAAPMPSRSETLSKVQAPPGRRQSHASDICGSPAWPPPPNTASASSTPSPRSPKATPGCSLPTDPLTSYLSLQMGASRTTDAHGVVRVPQLRHEGRPTSYEVRAAMPT